MPPSAAPDASRQTASKILRERISAMTDRELSEYQTLLLAEIVGRIHEIKLPSWLTTKNGH